ncbi:uncharacterized protein LOC131158324 [Malania oleifera]|uniref:uncharacterized protein LOC131158324 n=1 Tax=Malania oleifera TaxID=397392 RepID=UPI0025AE643C|nr:uncharacterized protein LOC131158324 [Malania oleifera]
MQAARLSLRMQKELRLLLSDPPPGASFPLLSPDADLSPSSLSTIHAQIEGPEGTVYANGIFNINIQIPERYPFQPPSVTFATPIYHPNIDTGGRICLDILNLPPKGAWQPSLNISTVLISIGLLLSEPNPDDGLMCEASREYKYNRQAFDQKARSMTEKYAKAGVNGDTSGVQVIQTSSNSTLMDVKGSDKGSKYEVNKGIASGKKPCGIGQNLSLEYSCSNQRKDVDSRVNETSSEFENQMEAKGPKDNSNPKGKVHGCNPSLEKLFGTRQKLSLGSSGQSKMRDGEQQKNAAGNHNLLLSELPSVMQASDGLERRPHQDKGTIIVNDSINTSLKEPFQIGQELTVDSSGTFDASVGNNGELPVAFHSSVLSSFSHYEDSHGALAGAQALDGNELQPQKDATGGAGNDFTESNCKKLCSFSKKLSLGSLSSSQRRKNDKNENLTPSQYVPPSHPETRSSQNLSTAQLKFLLPQDSKCHEQQQQSCLDQGGKIAHEKEQVMEESPISDVIIVLDSEESEEETNAPSRSKLLVARKRLAGKRKARV